MELVVKNVNDAFALHYVAERTGIPAHLLLPVQLLQIENGDEHCGTIVLNNFRALGPDKNAIELTFVADTPRAWTRKILRELAELVFHNLKCVRAVSGCADDNHKSREYLDRSGFVYEGREKLGWDGEKDKMWYGMTKETCTWLGEE